MLTKTDKGLARRGLPPILRTFLSDLCLRYPMDLSYLPSSGCLLYPHCCSSWDPCALWNEHYLDCFKSLANSRRSENVDSDQFCCTAIAYVKDAAQKSYWAHFANVTRFSPSFRRDGKLSYWLLRATSLWSIFFIN